MLFCRVGCGFYGNIVFEGMCFKCYKDVMKRKENVSTISGRLSFVVIFTVITVIVLGETDFVGNVISTLVYIFLGIVLFNFFLCVCVCFMFRCCNKVFFCIVFVDYDFICLV